MNKMVALISGFVFAPGTVYKGSAQEVGHLFIHGSGDHNCHYQSCQILQIIKFIITV
jgi:hypothetical protein